MINAAMASRHASDARCRGRTLLRASPRIHIFDVQYFQPYFGAGEAISRHHDGVRFYLVLMLPLRNAHIDLAATFGFYWRRAAID